MTSVIVTNIDALSDDEEDVEFESDADDEKPSVMEDEDETEEVKQKPKQKQKVKAKGRGFQSTYVADDNRYSGKSGQFDSVKESESSAQKSVEGYIVFISNVHEEAQEDDIYDLFADFGEVQQMQLNLDRRTGYVKGYALIEYETYAEAQSAIDNLNGHELLEQKLNVDWAFKKPQRGRRGKDRSRRR